MTTAIIVLIIFGAYWLPTAIAASRQHPQAVSIGVLNGFLGWTFLGWVVCLAMACSAIQPMKRA